MAANFAADLAGAGDCTVHAVGSRNMAKAAAFADRFGIPRRFESCAALAGSDIEAVYIATPHSSHCRDALECLEAGKAVLCEKPFAINHGEAGQMVEAAARSGVFLMEAMWTRFIPAVVQMREWLGLELIGEPQLMIAGGAFIPEFDPEFYLFRPELGGGVLLDAGVYLVSLASMVFGAPAAVRALGEKRDNGIDEHDAIILSHAAGGLASLYVSLRTRMPPELTLLGSQGSIRLHPPVFCPRRITLTRSGRDAEIMEFDFSGSGYRFQAQEVERCLREGRTGSEVMPVEESLGIMRTLDEIRAQLGVRYPME